MYALHSTSTYQLIVEYTCSNPIGQILTHRFYLYITFDLFIFILASSKCEANGICKLTDVYVWLCVAQRTVYASNTITIHDSTDKVNLDELVSLSLYNTRQVIVFLKFLEGKNYPWLAKM